jgi:hypothetical protein
MPHGGMLEAAAKRFPDAPRPFLDLSTGINPVPYEMPELPMAAFTRLPEAGALARLREVAAQAYGAADPAMVVAAPGTQILISALPYILRHILRRAGTVAVLSPTYGEHAAAWAGAGHAVTEVPTLAACENAGVAVVCNPNNPDGARSDPQAIRSLAERLAARGGLVVVDEAFADFEPGLSVVKLLPQPGILRAGRGAPGFRHRRSAACRHAGRRPRSLGGQRRCAGRGLRGAGRCRLAPGQHGPAGPRRRAARCHAGVCRDGAAGRHQAVPAVSR